MREFNVLLFSTFDVHSNYLSTFKSWVTGQKIRTSIDSRLVTCLRRWGNRDLYSKFRFQWSGLSIVLAVSLCLTGPKTLCLDPCQPGVNQSRKYLRTFLCHRISFCPFSSSPFLPKKIYCINRFLCPLALTGRWGVALQNEKSDLRFILRFPQQLIN